jgi:error-prone DNA polymerase
MIVHFHSYFSLRYGLMSPEEIVHRCESEGMSMRFKVPILLADINNVSGVSNFLKAARGCKHILPLVGCDIRNGDTHLYLLLSESQEGFARMNGFLSDHLMHATPFPLRAPDLEGVKVIYPGDGLISIGDGHSTTDDGDRAMWGVHWGVLERLRLRKAPIHKHRLLAIHTVTVRDSIDFETHRLLRCIDHSCLLTKLPSNATALPWHCWIPLRQIFSKFVAADYLLSQALAFAEGCAWTFQWNHPQNKNTFTGNTDQDFRMLRELATKGLHDRYPQYTFSTTQRLEKEMQMIYQLGFTTYFLINWDICRFAQENNFFYVGRGSGANSMVAYCLKITDVDPIDLDLYFERFINPHRSSPPDFDLDFSWQDRDHVTQYILNKYKDHGASLLATYSTFQTNAVVRELGKVFGLPKSEIDALLNKPSYYSQAAFQSHTQENNNVYAQPGIGHNIRNRTLGSKSNSTQTTTAASPTQPIEQNQSPTLYQELLKHAHRIHNLPNHLSIHVGGILIPEKHIHHYSATFLPPKGFPVVQFSMLEAEDLGIAKFDILSQRGLGHIKDAVTYIKQNQNIQVNIHQIHQFKSDERIQRLIVSGHTTGCFYVESPAMRQLLRKLKCSDYLTLVAASSVIRPGVARSGMMRTFIERHVQIEKRKEAHPVLWDLMPETYGIMVYQEDVIKVAHHFAGIGLGESDVLRRGMSGKFRSKEEFQKVKESFFAAAAQKGHKDTLIAEVWHQIESFAGYSFAKGHSASYAVESYQSLFLKAYYPLEFYTAVINNFGGFYRTEFYVHAARKSGANVQAPCINHSEGLSRIQEKTLWLGLGLIDGLEQKNMQKILQSRAQNGPFIGLGDFKQRVEPGLEQLKILIQIGACRCWQKSRKALMWEAHALYAGKKITHQTEKLFLEPTKEYQLPNLEDSWLEIAHDERNLLGFSLTNPFHMIKDAPYPHCPNMSHLSKMRGKHFSTMKNKGVVIEGYLVTVKPTKTSDGKEMNFGTWLDADGHYFDSIHFPPSLKAHPFHGRGVYRMWGYITEDFGVFNIEVSKMTKIPYQADPRFA